jgi:hypothetical protein
MMNRKRGVIMALAVGAATALMAGLWAPSATAAPAAKAASGAASSLTNAVSNSLVTTPLVTGLTLSAAQHRVAFAGLNPFVRYLDNDCTVNRVISQDPGAGTLLPAGSTVTLWVHPICNGPQP